MSQSFIWQYFPEQRELSEKIGAYFNCDPVIGQLMLNRSVYTIQDATHFMNHTWDNWPMLPNQGDLMAGLTALMDQQAAVCVYGDYDVDGVTSTALLVTLLRQAGCRVDYIVPHRFNDGYGLAMHRMDTIATKKYDALITIDCGISNAAEIDRLRALHPGIQVYIIDHHKCPPTLPNATAIVNPQMAPEDHPARHLCTAALIDYIFRTTPGINVDLDAHADLAAIGLIADVMPLTKLNRWYVHRGLMAIRQKPRPAILELCIHAKVAPSAICSRDIGFGIGPRLNAPGRLGDPRPAVELLLSNDAIDCTKKATAIEELNKKRRSIGQQIQQDIQKQLTNSPDLTTAPSIVCSGQFWHMGVIGINASRLVDQYCKPAIVIGFDSDVARGSARSVPGVNIYNILQKCAHTLTHFGGHSQAAGFQLDPTNIQAFKDAFMTHSKSIPADSQKRVIQLDAQLPLGRISLALIEELNKCEPFGEGNPRPTFYANVHLLEGKKVGKTHAHLKCRFEQDNAIIDAIGFDLGPMLNHLTSPKVRIAFHVSVNEYMGRVKPQIELIDIQPHGAE